MDTEQPHDEQPLRADLAAGRPPAFAALFDRYGLRLYRTALAVLGHPADAEDAVQELFVALVRSRDRLAEVDDLAAYLFASLRRSAARIAVRRQRDPSWGAGETTDLADHRISSPDDARAQALRRAVRQLPLEQREVLELKIDGELTFAQIGAVLGIGANTAASRYRYALEKLRDWLAD